MDEDRLARLEATHDHDKLPSGEIIDRDRGCFQRRHARGACENLLDRDAYSIGVAAKSGRRRNIAASPIRCDTRTNSIDVAADLIAMHDRDRRQVGINTQAAHNVGEINPACLDANPDFAGLGLRVGRFFHLKNFRRANLRDPNLPHDRDLGVRASSRRLYKSHLEDSRMTTNGTSELRASARGLAAANFWMWKMLGNR